MNPNPATKSIPPMATMVKLIDEFYVIIKNKNSVLDKTLTLLSKEEKINWPIYSTSSLRLEKQLKVINLRNRHKNNRNNGCII